MIEVNKKQDCCGCTACAAICPKDAIIMKEDKGTFIEYRRHDSNASKGISHVIECVEIPRETM